ncbi:MAG TPA: alpha/beta hydrolase-fold protein [Chitinophaga sp.]|uniref:alpha/beta hydrolase-fold protein n=1 Tax=Chitinophaga sp. TaxID=1869181 RepID=UPI002BFA6248|nr:alpha/beta hydrolase-fold protein [Chitinophaga sp.]HVI48074.1 alpha/beta hydrolase-fold protein [Chitinophaga sp.]
MKNRLFRFFILLAIVVSSVGNVRAQDTVRRVFDTGILDSLNSDILKQKRFIQVFLPSGYKPDSTDKYDVLYVLDGGNWNTGLIMKIQRFLEDERYIPKTIVVSIMGIDRNKDLTPTRIDNWETSGGAGKFLGFIKDELIPYINKTYPSNGDNTLWGHSLGGMFVINALLNAPQTFKSYIAVDPSLWWDNCYIQRIAATKLPAMEGLNATLYISGREGKEGEGMKIDSMNAVLKRQAPTGLSWKSVNYPDETHSSIRLKGIYDGLKFSYSWNNGQIEFHPMNGIVQKGEPVKVWYFSDTTKTYYTLDGTIPTILSDKMQREISLTAAARLYVKQFTNRARYDKMRSGDFIQGKALLPLSKPGNIQSGGFRYAYYEVQWDKFQGLKDLKPQLTGLTNGDFDTNKFPRKKDYVLLIDGLLETTEEGYYIFVLDADTGSKLYLNNQLLIDWQGDYSSRTYSYILPLKKGFYHLRLEYPHKTEDFNLKMTYLTPSTLNTKNPKPIPLNLQYSYK